MENKSSKTNSKVAQKQKSIRINPENQKKAKDILASANKKKAGRTVKIDHLLSMALDLVADEHIKKLQDQSLTHEDRKELLRQKWAELHGPISKDDFTGVTLTKEFFEFLSSASAQA